MKPEGVPADHYLEELLQHVPELGGRRVFRWWWWEDPL